MSPSPPGAGGLKGAAFVGVLWSLAQAWGVRLITLVHFIVIARLLEPSDLGIIAFATTVVACVSTLVDQGASTIIESTTQHDEVTLDSAWWSTTTTSIVASATLVAATPWIAGTTGKSYLLTLLPVLSLSMVLAALSTIQMALLRARFLHRFIALATLAATVAGAATGIGCALAGLAYWALVIKALVEAALISALLIWFSPWKPRLRFSFGHWWALLKAGAPVLGMRTVDIVNQRLDSLLIGTRLGPTTLGLYSTGQRIYAIAMEAMFSAVNQVSLPIFSRASKDPGRSAQMLLRVVACVSMLTFPAFGLMAVTGPDLITVVFGEKWRAAGPVLSAFSVGGILFSISYFNAPLMVANGRANQVFWLSMLNAAGNAVGFLLAVPYGATAVAGAYVLRGFLVYPVNLLLLRRTAGLSVRSYVHALRPAASATAVAMIVAGSITAAAPAWSVPVRLACAIATASAVYITIMWFGFRGAVVAALQEVRSMVSAARSR